MGIANKPSILLHLNQLTPTIARRAGTTSWTTRLLDGRRLAPIVLALALIRIHLLGGRLLFRRAHFDLLVQRTARVVVAFRAGAFLLGTVIIALALLVVFTRGLVAVFVASTPSAIRFTCPASSCPAARIVLFAVTLLVVILGLLRVVALVSRRFLQRLVLAGRFSAFQLLACGVRAFSV